MENRIGNWIIEDDSFRNENLNYYEIEFDRLLELRHDGCYDWLVHMLSKADLSNEDILDLNTVFLYLSIKMNLKINLDIFLKTIAVQRAELPLR